MHELRRCLSFKWPVGISVAGAALAATDEDALAAELLLQLRIVFDAACTLADDGLTMAGALQHRGAGGGERLRASDVPLMAGVLDFCLRCCPELCQGRPASGQSRHCQSTWIATPCTVAPAACSSYLLSLSGTFSSFGVYREFMLTSR